MLVENPHALRRPVGPAPRRASFFLSVEFRAVSHEVNGNFVKSTNGMVPEG